LRKAYKNENEPKNSSKSKNNLSFESKINSDEPESLKKTKPQ
jgi:hypothetical protein